MRPNTASWMAGSDSYFSFLLPLFRRPMPSYYVSHLLENPTWIVFLLYMAFMRVKQDQDSKQPKD